MTVFSLVASHHDLDLDTVARLSAGATGVGPALPGSGAAGALVDRLVQDARSKGLRIVPACSYVRIQFDRHPDWADVRAGA